MMAEARLWARETMMRRLNAALSCCSTFRTLVPAQRTGQEALAGCPMMQWEGGSTNVTMKHALRPVLCSVSFMQQNP